MAGVKNKLKLGSFNCRGFKSSQDGVTELFNNLDILAVQEHWLYQSEFHLLSSVADDALLCAVSPMEMDSIVLGRPYGV